MYFETETDFRSFKKSNSSPKKTISIINLLSTLGIFMCCACLVNAYIDSTPNPALEKSQTSQTHEDNFIKFIDTESNDTITLLSKKSLHIRAISSGRTGNGSRVHDSNVKIIIYEGILWGENTLYYKEWGVVKGIDINRKIKILDYKGLSSDYASDIYIN